ncbi:MAG: hypothetical protein HRU35_05975 [Rickettsiaceae bacterium]|nr:hypothetical protein [Rickettsiaceae bacterium]
MVDNEIKLESFKNYNIDKIIDDYFDKGAFNEKHSDIFADSLTKKITNEIDSSDNLSQAVVDVLSSIQINDKPIIDMFKEAEIANIVNGNVDSNSMRISDAISQCLHEEKIVKLSPKKIEAIESRRNLMKDVDKRMKDVDMGKTSKKDVADFIIEKYLDTNDKNTEKALQQVFEQVQGKKAKLLGQDSALFKFLDDKKNVKMLLDYHATTKTTDASKLNNIKNENLKKVLSTLSKFKSKETQQLDHTKLDLPVIKKCMDIVDKNPKLKSSARNYNELSTTQKVLVACSIVLAPITYYAFKASNKQKKQKLTATMEKELANIQKELIGVNAVSKKSTKSCVKNPVKNKEHIQR